MTGGLGLGTLGPVTRDLLILGPSDCRRKEVVCQLCPGTLGPVTKGGVTGDWGLPDRVWGMGARVFRGQVSRLGSSDRV